MDKFVVSPHKMLSKNFVPLRPKEAGMTTFEKNQKKCGNSNYLKATRPFGFEISAEVHWNSIHHSEIQPVSDYLGKIKY